MDAVPSCERSTQCGLTPKCKHLSLAGQAAALGDFRQEVKARPAFADSAPEDRRNCAGLGQGSRRQLDAVRLRPFPAQLIEDLLGLIAAHAENALSSGK